VSTLTLSQRVCVEIVNTIVAAFAVAPNVAILGKIEATGLFPKLLDWGSCPRLSAKYAHQPIDHQKDGDKPESAKREVWKLACDGRTEEKQRKIRATSNHHSQERVMFHGSLRVGEAAAAN
jgi:hypothetical protein